MESGLREVAFAVGSPTVFQPLVEAALVLFGIMIVSFVIYLLLGKI
jgi:hypothetical protein